jgi:integrase
MRCGEAFGLHADDLELLTGRIFIRRSVRNDQEFSFKTKKGYRVPNIEPALVLMLAAHLGDRKGGRVFETRNSTPLCKSERASQAESTSREAENVAGRNTCLPAWSR